MACALFVLIISNIKDENIDKFQISIIREQGLRFTTDIGTVE